MKNGFFFFYFRIKNDFLNTAPESFMKKLNQSCNLVFPTKKFRAQTRFQTIICRHFFQDHCFDFQFLLSLNIVVQHTEQIVEENPSSIF